MKAAKSLFLIKEGRVQLYRISFEGRKLVLAMLGPDMFFGEMPLFGQAMGDSVAQAVDDTTLCTLGRAEVERILVTYPRIGLRLIQVLNERLQEAEERLHESAFMTMPARTAALILRLAEESDEVNGLTHQDLADMLGVYRETVTATLDKLKNDNLLEIGRKRITLTNRSALEDLVQGSASTLIARRVTRMNRPTHRLMSRRNILLAAGTATAAIVAVAACGQMPEEAPKEETEPAATSQAEAAQPTPSPELPPNVQFSTFGWKTDFSKHSVPFDEISSGGPGKDGIPSIDKPVFITPEEATLDVGDHEPGSNRGN